LFWLNKGVELEVEYMMKTIGSLIVVFLLTLAFSAAPARAQEAPPEAKEAMLAMITAIIEQNRSAFVANATDELKEGLTEEAFTEVVEQISPVLKKGFKTRYLGSMKQQGFHVHLWVLTIRGEEDEMLGTLSMKNGAVGGFYLE